MNFNDNVTLFSLSSLDLPTTFLNTTENHLEDSPELPIKTYNGQDFIIVTLVDHSMFDRYYKDDLLTIRLQETCNDGADALVLLPSNTVTLRQIFRKNEDVILKALNCEFYEDQCFTQDSISVIGIVTKALRIN